MERFQPFSKWKKVTCFHFLQGCKRTVCMTTIPQNHTRHTAQHSQYRTLFYTYTGFPCQPPLVRHRAPEKGGLTRLSEDGARAGEGGG